jgi:hypothetical protein
MVEIDSVASHSHLIRSAVTDEIPGGFLFAKTHDGRHLLDNPSTQESSPQWLRFASAGVEVLVFGLPILYSLTQGDAESAQSIYITYIALKIPISSYRRYKHGDITKPIY